jgi:hypothetical protein
LLNIAYFNGAHAKVIQVFLVNIFKTTVAGFVQFQIVAKVPKKSKTESNKQTWKEETG